MVRLFVAWPGVEPSRGVYNQSYLNVCVLFVGVCPCYVLDYLWMCGCLHLHQCWESAVVFKSIISAW